MKVSIFVTCLVDQLYPDVGIETVRLLQRLGCQVVFPKDQICCGQPAFNSGYTDAAREVALNNLRAFESSDYVVCPSGSCTGMVHHYYPELFRGDTRLAKKAEELIEKTFELSQFLVNVLKVDNVGAVFPHTATYHPSCHGSRLLGAKEEPLRLLENVKHLQLITLGKPQDCCGFGGTFAVKMADISGAMVAEKVHNVVDTNAEYLIGTDMSCLMNITGALRRQGSNIECLHLAQVLNKGLL